MQSGVVGPETRPNGSSYPIHHNVCNESVSTQPRSWITITIGPGVKFLEYPRGKSDGRVGHCISQSLRLCSHDLAIARPPAASSRAAPRRQALPRSAARWPASREEPSIATSGLLARAADRRTPVANLRTHPNHCLASRSNGACEIVETNRLVRCSITIHVQVERQLAKADGPGGLEGYCTAGC
jgi:hypothetical protein